MPVQLISNVKIITSGVAPTTTNLAIGQMAFGKITADGLYHLYGNSGGADGATSTVVDLILESQGAIPTLNEVLTSGNATALGINFEGTLGTLVINGDKATFVATAGGSAEYGPAGTTITGAGGRIMKVNGTDGFTDAGYPVLTANPDNTINAAQATQMRTFLDVYSKAEIDGKLAGVFTFKGTVADADALDDIVAPAVGDAYQNLDNGLIYAWNGTDWIPLGAIIDLSNYYTKSEVNDLIQDVVDQIPTDLSDLDNTTFFVEDEFYNNFSTEEKAKVALLTDAGDGDKVLTDDGTYQTITLAVSTI